MINFFMKKMRKNMKGFTLIELIVVIAILGILAAIAIPRFSGFLDKGRQGADDQYFALISNNVRILMAEEKIKGTGTATIDNTTGTVSLTGFTPISPATLTSCDAEILLLLDKTELKYYKTDVAGTGEPKITFDADGKDTVDAKK